MEVTEDDIKEIKLNFFSNFLNDEFISESATKLKSFKNLTDPILLDILANSKKNKVKEETINLLKKKKTHNFSSAMVKMMERREAAEKMRMEQEDEINRLCTLYKEEELQILFDECSNVSFKNEVFKNLLNNDLIAFEERVIRDFRENVDKDEVKV